MLYFLAGIIRSVAVAKKENPGARMLSARSVRGAGARLRRETSRAFNILFGAVAGLFLGSAFGYLAGTLVSRGELFGSGKDYSLVQDICLTAGMILGVIIGSMYYVLRASRTSGSSDSR